MAVDTGNTGDKKPEDAMKDAAQRSQEAFRDAMDPEKIAQAQASMGFDPQRMQETLRTMTERSMAQSREAYGRMKSATDEAARTLESTMENVHNGSLTLSRKAIEAMRTNAEMGFSHLEKLASAGSVAEFVELQTGYLRRQMETVADQAREMQALSRDVAQDMARPTREAAERMKPGRA
ncbi:phasin family protein [Aureimonas mangrovi]|uniref:phasin family protein n=1 Tax=Aureimonas mangrovi TaxID=2758041 RepID=UPI001FE6F4E9|nr:phasin family protein [Aureimonas mangrovi]